MAINESRFIWHNGRMVPWEEATTHVLSHGLHYGSAVFEGIRVYGTPDGPKGFRLSCHAKRLFDSARVYRMEIPYTKEQLIAACKRTVMANGLDKGAYLRPIAYRGYGSIGVAPTADLPVDVAIAAMEWGAYLGEEGLKNGVDVCVSSWQRVAPNTIPAGAKAAGNYLSSQLISMEAKAMGFAEGIGLTPDGLVSEGAGENLFLVKDDVIFTPPSAAAILAGITRDSVMKLAARLGYTVKEQALPRELLYLCDELFFTGTAAEITPIRSVDRIEVGAGSRGPVTKSLQDAFFGLFNGDTEDTENWLEPVNDGVTAAVAV